MMLERKRYTRFAPSRFPPASPLGTAGSLTDRAQRARGEVAEVGGVSAAPKHALCEPPHLAFVAAVTQALHSVIALHRQTPSAWPCPTHLPQVVDWVGSPSVGYDASRPGRIAFTGECQEYSSAFCRAHFARRGTVFCRHRLPTPCCGDVSERSRFPGVCPLVR